LHYRATNEISSSDRDHIQHLDYHQQDLSFHPPTLALHRSHQLSPFSSFSFYDDDAYGDVSIKVNLEPFTSFS
jgi:hypothetical protein